MPPAKPNALRRTSVTRNLRKRRGFGLGGGGGGGGGGAAALLGVEGTFGGGTELLSRSGFGGIDVGGAVRIVPLGGCGGTNGILSGGTTASEIGVADMEAVADIGGIAPGAGSVGPFAV